MPALRRTRLTWLTYATNGASAFFVYSVGPATPLIARDLGISEQSAALHGAAMAAALLTTGALAARVIARWGRLATISMAMAAMALGVLVVVVAPSLAVSLLGTYLAGTGGGVAAVAALATLADAHPDAAPTVLTEANAAAGWVGLFAPLLMGAFLAVGLGWRVGLAVAIPLCLGLAVAVRSLRRTQPALARAAAVAPAAPPATTPTAPAASEPAAVADSTRSVPGVFWIVMLAVSAAAGAEFAVNYWGATLLGENTGATAGAVTAAMSAPVAGVAVGRTFGARLAMGVSAHSMLVGGWLVGLLGFAAFWRASALPVAVVGLFVTGLGLSVIFPLLLDRAVLLLPERKDWALAIVYPFVGVAVGLAPYGLGALAGQVGVLTAFLVVPLIRAVGLVAVLGSRPAPPG